MTEIDRLKIALYVLSNGGGVTKKSLYDEEGVEGWEWEFEGHEFHEVGCWDELPPIPNDLCEFVKSKNVNWNQ